ncbi:MAG: hypothetical protein JRI50_03710 [Deltaproteobacteria bacterium]|nr:hypothetical protein [Deltaproteobacteria bacterium]MBW2134369.1 hypothetical protein [Deltaproteobacteria bacterium]
MTNMDIVERLWNYRFLGREFLTWLWFKSEDDPDGTIQLPGQKPLSLEVGEKMRLEVGEGEYFQSLAVQGSHSNHQEARLGLRQGKTLEELHLKVTREDQEWPLTLKATTFEVKGLKNNTSHSLADEDDEAHFFDQMAQVEEITDILDGLFAEFLRLRLSPEWEATELPRLKAWMAAEV